ncbi:hypothetical protein IU449_13645 [Nocardia higoensis]|uniref:Uncharacterized protein n=1 Tax=Nocardia higoensis TaxID=228599 RepID=A0ABS0DAT7_9NOCA|nr:hypothetical protein [Nocardia higoensis]MBF6355575.1 hypothetical protein [Nocardia higoensis]
MWSDPDAAERAAAKAGLVAIEVRSRLLRLPLDGRRGLGDQVTEWMGALAAMRTRLEACDRWRRASARLDEYLDRCARFEAGAPVLVDSYLSVTGRKR